MLGTRYEEYLNFNDNLPFTFGRDIKITSTTYSPEANWHENLEIQFCTEGSGYVLMDTQKYDIEKNQIAVVNSNIIHHTNTSNMIKYDCLIIATAFCSQIGIDTSFLTFKPTVSSDLLLRLHQQLKKIHESSDDICRTAKLNKIIIEMLIELRENHIIEKSENISKPKSYDAITRAIKYIRKNYEKKLTLDLISKNSMLDKFTLSKAFKKMTNQTVIQYINSYRCKKATDYILSGKTVTESANLCGFTNMSFFTKTFKKYMGCMPHSYKNK